MRAHCGLDDDCSLVRRWFGVGWALVGHWLTFVVYLFVVGWALIGSLTGEARMFRLDEVGHSKKILIKGKLVCPASPTLIVRCIFNVFSPNGISRF